MQTILSTIQTLCNTLTKAGIRASVVSRVIGADDSDIGFICKILSGTEAVAGFGGMVSLEIQGW